MTDAVRDKSIQNPQADSNTAQKIKETPSHVRVTSPRKFPQLRALNESDDNYLTELPVGRIVEKTNFTTSRNIEQRKDTIKGEISSSVNGTPAEEEKFFEVKFKE